MALKKEDKINKYDKAKERSSTNQENKTKFKLVRKKYSIKKNELQVRKRSGIKHVEETNLNSISGVNQFTFASQGLVPPAMFYLCPQYSHVPIGDWSPVIPMPCPVYSLQTLPVIVNPPLLSTQICPYLPTVANIPAVTVPNEFPVLPLVSVQNEFSLQHLPNNVSPMETTMYEFSPTYSEMSPLISNGFSNVSLCNEVALSGGHFPNCYSPFPSQLSSDVTPVVTPIPNEFSPPFTFRHEFSQMERQKLGMYSTAQTMQVPHEFIPICSVSGEISPMSSSCYESVSCDYSEHESYFYNEIPQKQHIEEINDNISKSPDYYLTLPKDLFPTAKMLTIDPNAIIDEFCKVVNLDDHSWILDLEFGVPKAPVTRRIATYNVKLNSIHCKNTPEAIHPGYESCDKDLRRTMMFYYDCIISNWYRGYIAMSSDKSVENFQSWLLLPMQVFGMCWP